MAGVLDYSGPTSAMVSPVTPATRLRKRLGPSLGRYAPSFLTLLGGVGLVVLSLWYWASAPGVAAEAEAPHRALATWSVRLAAMAGLAAAQVLFLTFVVPRMSRPGRFDRLARAAAGVVFGAALAAAIVCALLV